FSVILFPEYNANVRETNNFQTFNQRYTTNEHNVKTDSLTHYNTLNYIKNGTSRVYQKIKRSLFNVTLLFPIEKKHINFYLTIPHL
ncbi:hypothetical protein L9F63_013762, partial [Diploptera punctata]